jgi:hypothetical protein
LFAQSNTTYAVKTARNVRSELVRWSSEPALHTRLPFGKYRGRRYAQVAARDPDYLRWIVEKLELEEGIKHSARYWLAAAAAPPGDPSG